MNIFTNEDDFKHQLARAGRMRLAGFICLALAFAAALYFQFAPHAEPLIVFLSYPFLIAGFPLWTLGNNRLRAYKAITRADVKLNQELKGFNEKFSLHHYVSAAGRVVKHVFVAPGGVVVIESRDTSGPITCTNDRWSTRTKWQERLAGVAFPLGDPTADVRASVQAIRGVLDSMGKPEVPIWGLIVFTRATDITEEECSYPAVPLDEAKGEVRQIMAGMESERSGSVEHILTVEDRRKLNGLLSPGLLPVGAKATPARAR